MLIIAEIKTDDGKLLGVMTLPPKEFKTGSRGYYANSKIEIDGKRYQTQIQLVEIGSKKADGSEQ
ncbi:MAG: hypothetical protein KA764_22290 [Anaerolineales bacterium]|nr:hypothetical protein [Anaerolineales bacterium]